MFGAVRGRAEHEPVFFRRRAQFRERIALGSHLCDVPAGKFALIHLKAVVMFGDGDDVFCPRFLKQLHPRFRVEFLGGEERNEVFIPHTGKIAVRLSEIRKTPRER